MSTGQKVILFIAGIAVLAGVCAYYYVFNKPHRDIAKEKPAYIMEASGLFEEFNMNQELGNEKFGNQIIRVSGKVAEITIDENGVSIILNNIMEAVNCAVDEQYWYKANSIKLGDIITIKGKCDGFDMIMGVVLTRCVLIE